MVGITVPAKISRITALLSTVPMIKMTQPAIAMLLDKPNAASAVGITPFIWCHFHLKPCTHVCPHIAIVHIDNYFMRIIHQCMNFSPITDLPEADWRLIRAFVAVMRTGTLTKAASIIGTTQPTVGRQIRELERRAGEPFFLRKGKKLEPTARAHLVYAQANDVEIAVTGLARTIAAADLDVCKLVRITTSVIFATELLPSLLLSVLQSLPDVDLVIIASDSIENLLRRDADIAIRFVRPTQSQLIAKRLSDVNMGLYAAQSYVAQHGLPLSVAELPGHAFIGNENASDIRNGAAVLGLNPQAMRIILRSESSNVRYAALCAGVGIGAAWRWLGDRNPNLVQVLPNVSVATDPVWLVAHEDIYRSQSLRQVFDGLYTQLLTALSKPL
jgi:DNA-binding transcriptional LysR family regulator